MTDEMIHWRVLFLFDVGSLFLALYPEMASTVPPDYCLYNLNISDCKAKPTLVFYYYKPGSRCEVDTWRGCPTYNKFDDQYQCSNTCIYRYKTDSSENITFNHDNGTDWKIEIDNLSDNNKSIVNDILDEAIGSIDSNVDSTRVTTAAGTTNTEKQAKPEKLSVHVTTETTPEHVTVEPTQSGSRTVETIPIDSMTKQEVVEDAVTPTTKLPATEMETIISTTTEIEKATAPTTEIETTTATTTYKPTVISTTETLAISTVKITQTTELTSTAITGDAEEIIIM